MSVAGSTSSQGTRSRSPSRSRSPPYSDGRYPPSSRYSRYDSYNYRPNRNGMSAALDDYRDLRDRERDRDRDRSMGLMRDDRYLSPRARESHDRYTPSYYRDDIPPSHHYASSSSPRDYPKTNPLRRDVSLDQTKDPNKLTTSSSNNSIKDLKDDTKPITSNSSEPYSSSRYMDWRDRDRDRERDRDRRYREDDRRRDYDRRGYMRDLRYESSSYGGPPPPMNYQIPPFGGDSYRPDRDRDRDMPPSPSIPYYERDRLEDRDFYRAGRSSSASSNAIDYDRYRARSRPNWAKLPEDSSRRLDRDRPERDRSPFKKVDDKKEDTSEKPSISTEGLETGEVVEEQSQVAQSSTQVTQLPQPQNAPQPVSKPQNFSQNQLSPQLQSSSEPRAQIPSQIQTTSPPRATSQPQQQVESQPDIVPQPQTVSEPQPPKELPQETRPLEPKLETVNDAMIDIKKETSPEPIKPTKIEQDSPQMEQGEVIDEEEEIKPDMTQEQIVNRIDDIENELSIEEELLAEAERREREALEQNALDEDDEDTSAQNREEAKKQAIQAMANEPSASSSEMKDFTEDISSPVRKRPQLLINQLRSKIDEEDDRLYEKILSDNREIAKRNQGEEETKPLYSKIEDYPCYKNNIKDFKKVRVEVAHALLSQKTALERKEKFLKKEYKALYEQWKEKNLALDRIRDIERKGTDKFGGHRTSSRRLQEQQPEEYTDGVIFTANSEDALRFSNGGASTPYNNNGHYTSDAARSEAELLEIIQSLESAEMRNPESRAKKTTATIPSMILDVRERMRTYDDRSRLVEDPLTYYHTGPDTGDVWNQQEVTTFMESYMMYPKQFERISLAIGTKTACQCVLFYYRKKKKIDFKALMKKGRRGKANKNRDRIAAAIRLATGDPSPSGRKAKSKGSALMTDIGEAQNSRKAKEKDAERKSKELRDLEQANQYWDSVAERKKTKRPSGSVTVPPASTPTLQSGPPSSASDDTDMMLTGNVADKRRSAPSTTTQQRRVNKGKSSRETNPVAVETTLVLPNEPMNAVPKRVSEEQPMYTATGEEEDDKMTSNTSNTSITNSGVAKWSEREKEMAIEGFKEYPRDFVQVSALVKSKTEDQCRNFYHNFKRKFGPNAFNEEDARQNTSETTDVHSELAAISGRTDLNPEEEDAAAALVGMFQMGANITLNDTGIESRSRTPSGDVVLPSPLSSMPVHHVPVATVAPMPTSIISPPLIPSSSTSAAANTQQPPVQQQQQSKQTQQQHIQKAQLQQRQPQQPQPPQPHSLPPPSQSHPQDQQPQPLPQPQQQVQPSVHSSQKPQPIQQHTSLQKRRRVRSTSSRAESITGDDTPESPDTDYGSRLGGRKLGRTTSLSESKRPAYSSYWSVSERNEFLRLLSIYGRDWERVANEMKSKTVIQVRNFYVNNEEKMQLKEVVDRHHSNKQDSMTPKSTFDTSAHFQALQNFPFPSPIVDAPQAPAVTSSPITNYPSNRVGYFSSPPPLSPRNNYPPPPPPPQNPNRSVASIIEPVPSAVTKVADLLNNDDPAEPNQKSWETWFGP